jgi:FemAB-related protein (PEP-CTERM system-associated)
MSLSNDYNLSDIEIRYATPSDKVSWDSYVLRHSYASPYHLYAWKEAVEKAYGFNAYYLIATEQNRITGIFPVFHLANPLGTGGLVALPYCDIGGPLADNETVEQLLIQCALDLGRQLKAKHLDVRGAVSHSILHSAGFAVEEKADKVRMFLSLPSSSEELWQSFRSKLRSQIAKAKKNGVTFSFSSNIELFYAVFAKNMHELGSPVHSYAWIKAVFEEYGNRARLGLVYCGQKAIGGGVLLNTDRQVSIPWASTLREFNHLSPNMLLYWSLLENSVERGFSVFDFGRSTAGEGTYRFKAQWGAQPVPLVWNVLQFRKKQIAGGNAPAVHAVPNQNEASFDTRAFAAKLWRLCPACFVNRTGPIIRKFISL